MAARISAASLRLTVVAPRMPWRRGWGVVMAPNVAALVRLMLVTDDRLVAGRDLVGAGPRRRGRWRDLGAAPAQAAAPAREQVALARALVAALRMPVLVNDRPDMALAAGAAGVHLGAGRSARWRSPARIAPPGFVIGASVGSEAEAAAAGGCGLLGHRPVARHHHQGRCRHRARRRRLRAARSVGRRYAVPGDRRGAPDDVPLCIGPAGPASGSCRDPRQLRWQRRQPRGAIARPPPDTPRPGRVRA